MPATKLLGTSPKGFNATGKFEQDDYHEFLESIQENDMNLLLDRHYLLLNKSEIMPKFDKNFKFTISWNPVDTPTAKEQAEINLIKAQSDQALIEAGSLSGEDIRNRIIKDKDSGYSGVVDETPPDDEVPPEKRTLRIEESNADQPVSKED